MEAWVCCPNGCGFRHERDGVSTRKRTFRKNSVGAIKGETKDLVTVWLIGSDEQWNVPKDEVCPLDVSKTGDKHSHKICNRCHCLLPVTQFDPNQTNKHGVIRRPTCRQCRTDIDKRAPKSRQAKQYEKRRPQKGSAFKCPICQKRSIVGITAKIVGDHDHHTGNIRDFICESCNTGLGRFKNGHDCLRDAIHYIEEAEGRWER